MLVVDSNNYNDCDISVNDADDNNDNYGKVSDDYDDAQDNIHKYNKGSGTGNDTCLMVMEAMFVLLKQRLLIHKKLQ